MGIIESIMDKFRYNINNYRNKHPLEFFEFCSCGITDKRLPNLNSILLENFNNEFDVFISTHIHDSICIRLTDIYQTTYTSVDISFYYSPSRNRFKDTFCIERGEYSKKFKITKLNNLLKILDLTLINDEYNGLIALKMPWISYTKEGLNVL